MATGNRARPGGARASVTTFATGGATEGLTRGGGLHTLFGSKSDGPVVVVRRSW
jgi:hypothetical protein